MRRVRYYLESEVDVNRAQQEVDGVENLRVGRRYLLRGHIEPNVREERQHRRHFIAVPITQPKSDQIAIAQELITAGNLQTFSITARTKRFRNRH